MLILGFDYGVKYIGVAVGQSITKTARPVASILLGKDRWSSVFKCIYDWSPSIIVVGYPLHKKFNNKLILNKIDKFINKIKMNFNIPIHMVDENLSTWEAKKNLKCYKNKNQFYFFSLNAFSAKILVEQWLFNSKN